ncbi:MAG TPA: hypothetical protein VL092_00720, partial [Chitinophagaceae bacterium]|nr:hypothetical protein [Chitinophagaceae bacterium]
MNRVGILLLLSLMCCCRLVFAQGVDSAALYPKTPPPDPKLQQSAQEILSRSERRLQDSLMKLFTDSFLNAAMIPDTAPRFRKTVRGIIRDFNTGEGIPFAQVLFPRSAIGNTTELDGTFS